MKDKCKCLEGKCLLNEIYPNSDASLACDESCYVADSAGEKHIDWYKKKYPKEFYKCFYTDKEIRKIKLDELNKKS